MPIHSHPSRKILRKDPPRNDIKKPSADSLPDTRFLTTSSGTQNGPRNQKIYTKYPSLPLMREELASFGCFGSDLMVYMRLDALDHRRPLGVQLRRVAVMRLLLAL